MWSVKESIIYISEPLTYIINLSINSGVVPDQMKLARMVPLFKSGDKRLFSNYRPVSVLPIFSKSLEKIAYFRLINYLDKHKLLASNQYGFRKNHSTSLALLYLYDKITAAVDERKYTAGLGIGRTWQIFGKLSLPCGRNLSSGDIAKCDPKFSGWEKTLQNRKTSEMPKCLGGAGRFWKTRTKQ